ncbi:MAG: hypothetical protein EO766_13435 [Hydrotalea sp. AMD]|uniref:hypothetical protein n=1 Tax=Hydrotalea sp. AMD TaxID=2501297 RepID=UPI0010262624|nr:hypothetical protein [Hydrotalea sp. AMD]RWZ86803.1 MAG: hypothetical protein EO766_13435 [Hydrotalea sp. AMD]
MSNQLPDDRKRTAPTGRPLQRLTWAEKTDKNYEWFKQNIDYYVHLSNFNFGTAPSARKDLRVLYAVYNNQFPLDWFNHITDPLNATNPNHKKYPAKVRPTSMIRTNLDLLLGEYPQRPFVYQVVNMGEDAYNSYTDGLMKAIQQNIEEHFLAMAQQQMAAAGHNFQEIPAQGGQQAQDGQQEIPTPEEVKERFNASYKDNIAIRGQKWVKRAIREYEIRKKFLKMFKDWLIAGRTYSYKNIENGNFIYERVSPLEFDFDKSPGVDYIEDGEWAIRRVLLTISDVVDKFYDELKDADHEELERRMHWVTPFSMYNYLQEEFSKYDTYSGKIPVYHVTWKGKKKLLHAVYTDPFTGQQQEMTLDEDTAIDDTIKIVKEEWVNEVYEGWRVGDDIFCRMRAIPVQRNQMNNFSTCKLPYNGKHYSDTHAENISVLEMGIPYAIMYMVTNFVLEKTIAKNKGKITLIDQNAIPQQNGWDEEKFFYYADALGYMLINRNQIGVDKSFNQYTTLDMRLFDDIKNLIELRDSFVHDWDALLGITPQRKAQVDTSAGMGTTQTAIFRSTIMTDMIFTLFEEFTERELQGFLDYSRFINVDGIRAIYNEDDFDKELLSIDPNSYCNAELGVFVKTSAEEQNILNQYKSQMQAMIQNGVKQSTILEIVQSNNVAELMAKLKAIEEIEARNSEAQQESEQEHEKDIERMKEQFLKVQSLLKIDEINAEWDRKDQNEMLKGEYAIEAAGLGADGGDQNHNGIPDATEITKRVIAAQKALSDERKATAEIASRERIHKDQMAMQDKQMRLEEKKLASKEKVEKMKVQASKSKAKSTKK